MKQRDRLPLEIAAGQTVQLDLLVRPGQVGPFGQQVTFYFKTPSATVTHRQYIGGYVRPDEPADFDEEF